MYSQIQGSVTREEYDIYSSAVDSLVVRYRNFRTHQLMYRTVLLAESTIARYPFPESWIRHRVPDLELDSLRSSFVRVNEHSSPLSNSLINSNIEKETLSRKQYNQIVADSGFVTRSYPDAPGMYEFSRVGIDHGTNYAAFILITHVGILGGSEGVVVLRKLDGRWILISEIGMSAD